VKFTSFDPANPPPEGTVSSALKAMLQHPISVILWRWNWKSALLSALFRAPIFFAASASYGALLALEGAGVEAIFNAAGAGLYGAFLQNIRKAKPAWLAWLVAAWLVPAMIQLCANAFHYAVGTSRLHRGIIISICLSAASATFNLFAMQRGSLLSGPGSETLLNDLGNMPRLILDFVLIVPRRVSGFFRVEPGGEGEEFCWGEKRT